MFFITVCTQNHECLFGEVVDGKMELKNKYPNIELDEYMIMPNHFHGIIVIQNKSFVGANQFLLLPFT
jgi:putative transposase